MKLTEDLAMCILTRIHSGIKVSSDTKNIVVDCLPAEEATPMYIFVNGDGYEEYNMTKSQTKFDDVHYHDEFGIEQLFEAEKLVKHIRHINVFYKDEYRTLFIALLPHTLFFIQRDKEWVQSGKLHQMGEDLYKQLIELKEVSDADTACAVEDVIGAIGAWLDIGDKYPIELIWEDWFNKELDLPDKLIENVVAFNLLCMCYG